MIHRWWGTIPEDSKPLCNPDYRRNHGNAPVPNMPSRGLVIADHPPNHSTTTSQHQVHLPEASSPPLSPHNDSHTSPPLRLLVIGDSLAAGVGTSQSSTPVLPHSIALHLSFALDGRAVVWTCVGVPGQSSASLVHQIEDLATTTRDVLVERWWFHVRRRQERLAAAWDGWGRRRSTEDGKEWDSSSSPSSENRIVRWWRCKKEQVKRDWEHWKRIVQSIVEEDSSEEEDSVQELRRRVLMRRQTRQPDMRMGNYDIAVVLTGLNDLKESYLPFMMPRTGENQEHGTTPETLRDQFVDILKGTGGEGSVAALLC